MASERKSDAREDQENENVVSMVDVLEEESQLEADANAVLGDSDDKNCTYPSGYVPRQALYACSTCTPPSGEPAGVCLACSLECHDGHDLYELYTKRNFRCDCGNSKFSNVQCKLIPDKDAVNSENTYSQNFTGQYCTCHRPYPDPEDNVSLVNFMVEDEMHQCIVCEDWYHGRHLGTPLPEDDNVDEVVCSACMERCDFLRYYMVESACIVKLSNEESTGDVKVDGEDRKEANGKQTADNKDTEVPSKSGEGASSPKNESDAPVTSDTSATHDAIPNLQSSESSESVDPPQAFKAESSNSLAGSSSGCLLESLKQRQPPSKTGGALWRQGWRKKLCRCSGCKAMYERLKVNFLLDESDTIHAYEARGRAKHTSQYDQGMQALSRMDRIQQVELASGFNDMKSGLSDYLKKFAENGKVVREEDIREFFANMANKRRKTSGFQYHCK